MPILPAARVTRAALRQIDRLAAERGRVCEPLLIEVRDDHDRRAQQQCRGRRGQPNRSGAGYENRRSRGDAGVDAAVIAGWQDIRETGQVLNLLHRLRLVGELQQVEVGVRNHDVFGLSSYPSAHVHIAIGTPGAPGVHSQAYAGFAFSAVPASAARHVERSRHQVADFEKFDVGPNLDHFAGDLVAQNESCGRRGAPSDHMLVTTTDVRDNDLQNHAVLDRFADRIHQFWIVDALNFDFTRLDIHDTTIACHRGFLLLDLSECCGACLGDGLVLRAGAPAHAHRALYFPTPLERNAAGKNHDPTLI